MKIICFFLVSSAFAAWAQTPAPPSNPAPAQIPPETVVAEVNGKKLTWGELQNFMGMLPPQMQQNLTRDRKMLVRNYALMMRLSEMAEKNKLDQQSPYKEMLQASRLNMLANAQINDTMNNFDVRIEDQKQFYQANQDRYAQVKLKVLYISFASNPSAQADSPGKKLLSEAEAQAKIEKLLADARAGADFVKLVKEHSQDETSVKKDGDFGTIRKTDNIPDAIRAVVFSLKPSQISDPVRQPNGFYLFRAEEVGARPFDEVRDEIFLQIRQNRLKEWLDSTTKSLNIKFENEGLFGPAPPAPAAK